MSIFIDQAKFLLESVELNDPKIKQARIELQGLMKTSALGDLIHDPKFNNIINLLTPFVVNYKVNQVLKLLKEIEKENRRVDPHTGLTRYI